MGSLKTDIKWHYTSYKDLYTKVMRSGDKPMIGLIKVATWQLAGLVVNSIYQLCSSLRLT